MPRNVLGICSVTLFAVLTVHAGSPPNLETALAAQHELAASRPYDASVHNDLGNLLVLDGRYDEAERSYRRAIEIAPGGASARFNLGVLLQQLGRAKEAQAELRGVLEIDNRHARTYYQLGMLYEERKQRSQAIEHYARSFALDPELTFARVNPHIIDNGLATEAILVSRRYLEAPSTDMPRLYTEPERIAELMLGPEPGAAPAAAPVAEAEPSEEPVAPPAPVAPAAPPVAPAAPGAPSGTGAAAAPAPAQVPVPAPVPAVDQDDEDSEDEDPAEEARRVLTPQNLQQGSGVGQVQRQGTAARRRVPTTSTPKTDTGDRSRVVRPTPERPSSAGRTPENRPRYRPPTRLSTGRLELKLLPPEESEPVTRAAR